MSKSDFCQQIYRNLNSYELIHIFNGNDTYYLTATTIIESALIQNKPTFFYHVLRLDLDQFNNIYGSFAYLKPDREDNRIAYLYLSVDPVALAHIIRYIQLDHIDGTEIYRNNYKDIAHFIHLAGLFDMPMLMNELKALMPTEQQFENFVQMVQQILMAMCCGWEYIQRQYPSINFVPMGFATKIPDFMTEHKDLLKQW